MIYRDLIKIKTEKDGVYDVTKQVAAAIEKSKVKEGLCNVFLRCTTAGLVLNENDRMLIEDFRKTLGRLVSDEHIYQHPDNAPTHLRAALLGAQMTIPVSEGKLIIGNWQSIMLFELDIQSRDREIIVTVQGA